MDKSIQTQISRSRVDQLNKSDRDLICSTCAHLLSLKNSKYCSNCCFYYCSVCIKKQNNKNNFICNSCQKQVKDILTETKDKLKKLKIQCGFCNDHISYQNLFQHETQCIKIKSPECLKCKHGKILNQVTMYLEDCTNNINICESCKDKNIIENDAHKNKQKDISEILTLSNSASQLELELKFRDMLEEITRISNFTEELETLENTALTKESVKEVKENNLKSNLKTFIRLSGDEITAFLNVEQKLKDDDKDESFDENDEDLIICGMKEGLINIYSIIKSRQVKSIKGHNDSITDLVNFGNFRKGYFASCSRDGYIKVWDTTSYLCVKEFKHEICYPLCLENTTKFNNQIILTGDSNGYINIWHLQDKMTLIYKIFEIYEEITVIRHLKDYESSKFILAGSSKGNIILWNLANYTVVQNYNNAHKGIINEILYVDKLIISCGDDTLIKIWSIENTDCIWVADFHKSPVTCLTINKNPLLCVSGSQNGDIISFNPKNKSLVSSGSSENKWLFIKKCEIKDHKFVAVTKNELKFF